MRSRESAKIHKKEMIKMTVQELLETLETLKELGYGDAKVTFRDDYDMDYEIQDLLDTDDEFITLG